MRFIMWQTAALAAGVARVNPDAFLGPSTVLAIPTPHCLFVVVTATPSPAAPVTKLSVGQPLSDMFRSLVPSAAQQVASFFRTSVSSSISAAEVHDECSRPCREGPPTWGCRRAPPGPQGGVDSSDLNFYSRYKKNNLIVD